MSDLRTEQHLLWEKGVFCPFLTGSAEQKLQHGTYGAALQRIKKTNTSAVNSRTDRRAVSVEEVRDSLPHEPNGFYARFERPDLASDTREHKHSLQPPTTPLKNMRPETCSKSPQQTKSRELMVSVAGPSNTVPSSTAVPPAAASVVGAGFSAMDDINHHPHP